MTVFGPLFDWSTWPVWLQAVGTVVGLYGLWKLLTVPYWGPAW